MKTVLLAAAGSLFLAFAAHAADETPRVDAPQAATSQASPAVSATGPTCIDGAAVSRTASTDQDAEDDSASSCSQYLSTQTLVQPPAEGRT